MGHSKFPLYSLWNIWVTYICIKCSCCMCGVHHVQAWKGKVHFWFRNDLCMSTKWPNHDLSLINQSPLVIFEWCVHEHKSHNDDLRLYRPQILRMCRTWNRFKCGKRNSWWFLYAYIANANFAFFFNNLWTVIETATHPLAMANKTFFGRVQIVHCWSDWRLKRPTVLNYTLHV